MWMLNVRREGEVHRPGIGLQWTLGPRIHLQIGCWRGTVAIMFLGWNPRAWLFQCYSSRWSREQEEQEEQLQEKMRAWAAGRF